MVTPLTPSQQAAVDLLLDSRRIEPVGADAARAEALGRFLRAVLDDPPGDRAARRFDQLRRARNQGRYEAKPVGSGDASLAADVARELLEAARTRMRGDSAL
jgi:hypothetical protein